MQQEPNNKRPLCERIQELGSEVSALQNAIREELDWREKARAIGADDDEDEAG